MLDTDLVGVEANDGYIRVVYIDRTPDGYADKVRFVVSRPDGTLASLSQSDIKLDAPGYRKKREEQRM
jgi:ribulose bisphosphate carboxylase small subunit